MSTARQRFLELLRRDILELDAAELDFGIYRVLNHRRAELEAFLATELPARITAALACLPGLATEDEEARVYNALFTFFNRYYDSGDFLPRQRRGKTGRYSVPYDGSDTHFHWATKGSHYVKSGERFAAYAYRQADGTRVRLVVQAANVERDNAKGTQRHYLPVALHAPGGDHPDEWRLAFEHRPLADDEAKAAGALRKPRGGSAATDEAPDADEATATEGASVQERIVNAWFAKATASASVPAPIDAALLQRHALRYAKGQSTDFFVHPQLGPFLRDELDHYLQTEFVHLWDLPDAALARERGKLAVARDIGRALITVLAALEDLQAALFEKRKFVMQAHYLVQCSWLARQGADGAALVQQACLHAPQVARWRQWLGEPEGSTVTGADVLARCPHIPLDTALFDEAFQWAVLAAVPDLQAALGGVLVHGDNYAALRTLQAQWREAVKCIYIDPPYNTDASPIDYKNGFRESSWISLMTERVECAKSLLPSDGVLVAAIDDAEESELRLLLNSLFKDNLLGTVPVRSNPSGRPTKRGFSVAHEYMHFVGRSELSTIGRMNPTDEQAARFNEADEQGPFEWRNLRREGSNSDREARRALHYPIFVSNAGLRVPRMTWDEDTEEWELQEKPQRGEQIVLPLDDKGNEKTWRWGHEKVANSPNEVAVREDRSGKLYPYCKRRPNEEGVVAVTAWFGARYSATEHGTALLKKLFRKSPFKYPKSLFAVLDSIYVAGASNPNAVTLDFFAGSGTTAHAVINLNRDDGGTRRFILVEQGEYFDTVTLPRVAKVMACPEWKDGRPREGVLHQPAAGEEADEHWAARTLPIVQVLRIERYEDSLDALALPGATAAAGQAELAGFDALLRYVVGTVAQAQAPANPVRLSTAALRRPLDYRLPTVWEGQAVERPVDLLHTSLLLLGLHPVRLRQLVRPAAAGGGTALLAEVRPHRPGQPASTVPLELLLLREHDLEDLPPEAQGPRAQAEYDWLARAVQQAFGRSLASYARVHHNRDLLLPGAGERGESIDAALAAAMWQRDPAFSPASPAQAGVLAMADAAAAD
jgi:adenine-specific DNA-methyltransferase